MVTKTINPSNENTGASGTLLQGQGIGTASAYTTATYPASSGTAANVITSNGTNFVSQPLAQAGFVWNDVTSGAATVAAQNGYKADKSTLTTFTLPTNNALGDTIIIMGSGSGGWTIVYTTSQYIQVGSSATTTTTGNLASTNQYDCVELVCITASASAPIFQAKNFIGNLSIT